MLGLVEEGAALSATPSKAGDATSTPLAGAPTPVAEVPVAVQGMPLSPAVRKLVGENNIDPKAIVATGKDGRLTKADVLSAIEKGVVAPVAPTVAASAHAASRIADSRKNGFPCHVCAV